MDSQKVDQHLTAKIVGNYVRHHTVEAAQLSDLITTVRQALDELGQDLSGLRLPRENATTAYHHKTRVEWGRLPEALGIAERSSTDRSSLFGAAFDAGEGTWTRSEAQNTHASGSVTSSSTEAGRRGSGTQCNAHTETEIRFCIEHCGCHE